MFYMLCNIRNIIALQIYIKITMETNGRTLSKKTIKQIAQNPTQIPNTLPPQVQAQTQNKSHPQKLEKLQPTPSVIQNQQKHQVAIGLQIIDQAINCLLQQYSQPGRLIQDHKFHVEKYSPHNNTNLNVEGNMNKQRKSRSKIDSSKKLMPGRAAHGRSNSNISISHNNNNNNIMNENTKTKKRITTQSYQTQNKEKYLTINYDKMKDNKEKNTRQLRQSQTQPHKQNRNKQNSMSVQVPSIHIHPPTATNNTNPNTIHINPTDPKTKRSVSCLNTNTNRSSRFIKLKQYNQKNQQITNADSHQRLPNININANKINKSITDHNFSNTTNLSKHLNAYKFASTYNKITNTYRQIQRLRQQKLREFQRLPGIRGPSISNQNVNADIHKNRDKQNTKLGKFNKFQSSALSKKPSIFYTYNGDKLQAKNSTNKQQFRFVLDMKRTIGKITNSSINQFKTTHQIFKNKQQLNYSNSNSDFDKQNNIYLGGFDKKKCIQFEKQVSNIIRSQFQSSSFTFLTDKNQ